MSSRRLLATRSTLRISGYGVVMNIGSLVERRRCSGFPTLKVKAIGKEDQSEPRFPHNIKKRNQEKRKVALVTGEDSGIGRAVCYAFAKEGATIAFTYVKGDEDVDATDTLKIIKEAKTSESSDPTAIPTDLGYNKNCQNVVDEVIAKYGRIDVLINNPAV
ncbi:Glucose/ribitol dehydrogenase, partial [Cynara cardunculus var. scolymus]